MSVSYMSSMSSGHSAECSVVSPNAWSMRMLQKRLTESCYRPGTRRQNATLLHPCLHPCHIPPSGSVEALELVRSSSKASARAPATFLQAQGAKGKGRPPGSLFELLQRTRTAAGSR